MVITTTITQTHLNEFLHEANSDVDTTNIINNHFEPANIISLIDDFRNKDKLTPELISALIELDPYETPNIYPYLQDSEKRYPGVTENAISRWKWNAAWTPDNIFEPLADACLEANRTREFGQGRWFVGHYHWCNEDPCAIPAIARIDKNGDVLQCALTREMAIYNGGSFKNAEPNLNYGDLINTADEEIASMQCIHHMPSKPPPVDSYDFRIGSLTFWNHHLDSEANFVRHRIQYTPQHAARIILNSAITQRYLRSPGGPIERAWHPTKGQALRAYAQQIFTK